jgi:Zn-dependent alcohol dehydrogenase
MKAAVCREFGKPLTIEDVTLADPGPGEIRVKMAACAICHSDIIYADGGWGGALPAVYGHEAAGVVDRVGPGVTNVKLGDHIVVALIRSCGGCHYCAQGHQVQCETSFSLDQQGPVAAPDGSAIWQGLRTGAFAEYATVHASQAVAIPKDIPLASASLLACGVITGFGAVKNTAQMPSGAHAVVIGTGGVGLNSVQGAALGGARTVIAVDLSDEKLAASRKFGATHTVNPTKGNAVETIRGITGGRGADYVFVTVGVKPAFDSAIAYLGKNGTLVCVGMPPNGVLSDYEPGNVAFLGQHIIGSKMGSARLAVDVPFLVELYQQKRLKLDELISKRFPLAEINTAIAEVKRGEALRNVIVF